MLESLKTRQSTLRSSADAATHCFAMTTLVILSGVDTALTGLPPRFDPVDPVLLDDPYPTYARFRDAAALVRSGPGTWAVTRHAEVSELLRDRRLGHEFPENTLRAFALAGGLPDTALRQIIAGLEPPKHTGVRRLMSQALSPAVVRDMQDRTGRFVDTVLDSAIDRGGLDVVTDLALPLQTMVACDLIGAPEADRTDIVGRAMDVGRVFILVPFAPEGGPGAQEGAVEWLRGYVRELLAERRRTPGDDLLSRMASARHRGERLSDDAIIDNAVFLFFAGFETSIHLVAGGCATLLAHQGQWRRLRAQPSMASQAVEEILRYDAPIQWVARVASAPVAVSGRTIRSGRAVLLLLASANHDERRFYQPSRLDIERSPNPHVSLSAGIHTCLGSVLARAQGTITFERLARRLAVLQPAAAAIRRPHPNLRGYTSVPVAVRGR